MEAIGNRKVVDFFDGPEFIGMKRFNSEREAIDFLTVYGEWVKNQDRETIQGLCRGGDTD